MMPALITALGDADEDIRRGAAAALGQTGSAAAKAIPALMGAVEDRDPNIAQAVSAALKQIRSASSAASS